MSLLKTFVNEEAAAGATSAASVAAVHSPIGGPQKRVSSEEEETLKKKKKKKKKKPSGLFREMALSESDDDFDAAAVVSQLKAAEKSATLDGDTVAFGLEDDKGKVVKVYVRSDEAEDFEAALAAELSDEDNDDNDKNSSKEIAAVLFELKDKFEIVDIKWGAIPEDEEETQEVAGEEGLGDEEGMGDEEMTADDEVEDTDAEDAKSALTQVIDMLKSDAEAKKAEAEAKKAAAEADSAKYAAQAAEQKVKQEEEVLDMEAYNKSKADVNKESKRIASLAKYKHDLEGDAEVEPEMDVSPEEEEKESIDVNELTKLLRQRLAAQN